MDEEDILKIIKIMDLPSLEFKWVVEEISMETD